MIVLGYIAINHKDYKILESKGIKVPLYKKYNSEYYIYDSFTIPKDIEKWFKKHYVILLGDPILGNPKRLIKRDT